MNVIHRRYGHCCNSSSSHSIVWWDKDHLPIDDNYGPDFGWDNFTLSDKESKKQYFAAIMAPYMDYPAEAINAVMKYEFGIDTSFTASEYGNPRYDGFPTYVEGPEIDHQSKIWLPRTWEGTGVNLKFAHQLLRFLLRDDVVILGGNDNSDVHPLYNGRDTPVSSQLSDVYEDTVCRHETGDVWSIFERKTGNLVRFSFGEVPDGFRPFYPELVDVKITDFCLGGATRGGQRYLCNFCYQDSGPNGRHALEDTINAFARWCSDSRIFSVAIGGGEPTDHPQFTQIIDSFASYNVVPNFTTRATDWLFIPRIADVVSKHCGAVAFSVDGDNYGHVLESIVKSNFPMCKVVFQMVPGLISEYILRRIMNECLVLGLRVSLLGYKTSGRGKPSFNIHDELYWLRLVKEGKAPTLSIDTVMASKCEAELEGLRISKSLYETTDGHRTIYYDAVNNTLNSSSYSDLDKAVAIPTKPKSWPVGSVSCDFEAGLRLLRESQGY